MVAELSTRQLLVEYLSKKSSSLRLRLFPKQVIVGNVEIVLKENSCLTLLFNINKKICLKFYVKGNRSFGYSERDFEIALGAIELLTTKTGESCSDPPAIAAHVSERVRRIMINELGDVQNRIYLPKKQMKDYVQKQLIFVLDGARDEAQSCSDYNRFMELYLEDQNRQFYFDMNTSFSIFNTEIRQAWEQCLFENRLTRKRVAVNKTFNVVEPIEKTDWAAYTTELGLHLKRVTEGEYKYFLFTENPMLSKVKYLPYLRNQQIAYKNTNALERLDLNAGEPENVQNNFLKRRRIEENHVPISDNTVTLYEDHSNENLTASRSNEEAESHGEDPLFTYPLKGSTSNSEVINVCLKDARTLDRNEFVNDVIMQFMISYMSNIMKPEIRESIHIFNTFFYSSLSKQILSPVFSMRKEISGALENAKNQLRRNIELVSKWTKKFDVFQKDYIVIPINEDLHWLLIIVANPGGAIVEKGENLEGKPKTFIIFIDPLSGLDPSRRIHMSTCIKEYLLGVFMKTKTANGKFATKNDSYFEMDRVEVIKPRNAPIQQNFSDCGLYVLYYIEALFCGIRQLKMEDIPKLDWDEKFPEASAVVELMRDKVYNLILHYSSKDARSRLEKYERATRGLSNEGARRHRRHSQVFIKKRDYHYYPRHYSLNPPARGVPEDKTFSNPRDIATQPLTVRVRQLRLPEYNFPTCY